MRTSNDDSSARPKAPRKRTRRAHKRDRSVSPEAQGATRQGGAMLPKRSRMMSALESQSPIDGDYKLPTGASGTMTDMPDKAPISHTIGAMPTCKLERRILSCKDSAADVDEDQTQ
ncbi:MAG: hypothetical protein Q9226_007606, partial [Calogaya cf. arnoldii]